MQTYCTSFFSWVNLLVPTLFEPINMGFLKFCKEKQIIQLYQHAAREPCIFFWFSWHISSTLAARIRACGEIFTYFVRPPIIVMFPSG